MSRKKMLTANEILIWRCVARDTVLKIVRVDSGAEHGLETQMEDPLSRYVLTQSFCD